MKASSPIHLPQAIKWDPKPPGSQIQGHLPLVLGFAGLFYCPFRGIFEEPALLPLWILGCPLPLSSLSDFARLFRGLDGGLLQSLDRI